ncbi:hypothetical protein [Streptomyces viridochromogenes]|uniref:hypothetical protein n=1 Tax=Streptomyces viridochromogenes TaxID=1938 RepID=UPI001F1D9385|nr:hypothetical protein [Streptomyces viridochromogenes]
MLVFAGTASGVPGRSRTSVEFRDEPPQQAAERLDVFVRPPAEPLLQPLALVLPHAGEAGAAGVGEFQQLGPRPRRMGHGQHRVRDEGKLVVHVVRQNPGVAGEQDDRLMDHI